MVNFFFLQGYVQLSTLLHGILGLLELKNILDKLMKQKFIESYCVHKICFWLIVFGLWIPGGWGKCSVYLSCRASSLVKCFRYGFRVGRPSIWAESDSALYTKNGCMGTLLYCEILVTSCRNLSYNSHFYMRNNFNFLWIKQIDLFSEASCFLEKLTS